jgi:hypothetical protein
MFAICASGVKSSLGSVIFIWVGGMVPVYSGADIVICDIMEDAISDGCDK